MGSFEAQELRSFVDTTQIEIGMPIKLSIQVKKDHPQDTVLFTPYKPQDTLGMGLEVLEVKYDTLFRQKNMIIEQEIIFTSWEDGMTFLLPILLQVNGDSLYTKQVAIGIDQPTVPEEINDIKNIITKDKKWWEYLIEYWYFGLIAVLIIAMIIVWQQKRKNQQQNANIQPSSYDKLKKETIRKLKALSKSEAMKKGDVKAFYSEYSDILKEFIHLRYKIPAKELFTSDLLHLLENKHLFADPVLKDIKNVFRRADLAKFAKIKPSENQAQEDIQTAISIVESVPDQSIDSP